MLVYRLAKAKFAKDLKGEGARLYGGRWNHPGVPCIYTSASRALALLEYTVNININDIPRALSMVTINIPDDDIKIITKARLPGNWMDKPVPEETKNFGSALFKASGQLVIQIPSVVIPDEFNYLLNPLHKRAKEFKVVEVEDFVYDVRIKGI